MILSGSAIVGAVEEGDIIIDPFSLDRVSTNSYDFSLQDKLLVYREPVLDPRVPNETDELLIPPGGLILRAGNLYLGSTVERMGSTRYVPVIKGKSSIARLGLFIHATADLIDLGSINNWTLQLIPTLDVRVFAGMLIGQVTFWMVLGERTLYKGKYGSSAGPMASLAHLDFPKHRE